MMKKIIVVLSLLLALASCDGGNKPICGYIVGKVFEPEHMKSEYHPYMKPRWGAKHVPNMWFVYVADSTGVRKVRVNKHDFNNARKGEYARYRTDGSTQD